MKTSKTDRFLRNQQALKAIANTHPAVMTDAALNARTQAEIRDVLRKYPISDRGPLDAAVYEVLDVRTMLQQNQTEKRASAMRVSGRTPRNFVPLTGAYGRAQKLYGIRSQAFKDALDTAEYRFAANGGIFIEFTNTPTRIGVSQDYYDSWEVYAKSYNYPAHCVDTTITAPADWRVRVERRGLAVMGGLVNLDVVPLDCSTPGVTLFAATWLQNGRGNELRAESGYIGIYESSAYHAATPEKAVRGALRKAHEAHINVVIGRQSLGEVVARTLSADPNISVTFQDARAIGACVPGIKAWCSRTNIDFGAQSVPLSEIFAAYQRVPATEAAAAILHAIRRHRRVLEALISA